jgi:hypothetical protein
MASQQSAHGDWQQSAKAAACVWNLDESFRARSSHLDSGIRGRHASFDYMRCHASYPACSRPSKTDSQYANPNPA